jgi:hypothetical protein
MKNYRKLLVLVLALGVIAPIYAQKIIGYIPRYRSVAQMDAAIEWDKMTDYYYFGSTPTGSGGITIEEPARFQHVLNKGLTHNKNVWLSVGGWGKSTNFITIANNQSNRDAFAQKALDICQENGLKGIDIDWEFPSAGQEIAFKNFFKTLYEKLNPEGYLVSAACGGEQGHADKWLSETFNYIDDLNIMSYDDPNKTDGNHSSLEFMKESMDLYNARGCPYEKMLGGVAFYSRCSSVKMYSEILNGSTNKQNTYENDITGGKCYNGKNTIEEKIDYVMTKGGVGVLIWEVTQDVKGQYSLLNVCDDAMDKYKCSAPTPELGESVSICGLNSVTLNAGVSPQSGVTFTWKDESQNLVNQSTNASTFDASSAGIYTLEVWQDGCNRSDEIEVTGVLNVPDLGGPFELCDPVSVTLDASVSSIGRTIEWKRDNQILPGENNSILQVKRGGDYQITVSASGCPSVNSSATVTSEVPYADHDTICLAGDQATIEASEVVKWFDSESATTAIVTQQIFNPTVNSTSTYWMGGAGSALTEYTTLKASISSGWGPVPSNYGRKITVISELNIDAISVSVSSGGSLKMNLKSVDGSTILKTLTSNVGVGEQEIILDWNNIQPGDYFIDAFGSTAMLFLDQNAPASDFEIPGIFFSEANNYGNWGSYSANTMYGFFYNLKLTAGKECAKVPVNVIIDSNNEECLTVLENEISFKNMNIYPNPSTAEFIISNAVGEMSIYDVKGSLIDVRILKAVSTSFGSDLKEGVYFVHLKSNNSSITRKIIKK